MDLALSRTKEKAMEWANKARNSHLPPRDLHFRVARKFWPKIGYGLCAIPAPYDALVNAMHKPYHVLISIGGVIQSAKRELRYLDSGFYGAGLPHWGIESMVSTINKLMSHYGTQSLPGLQFQKSTELLTIELGLGDQPFLADYDKHKDWATDCTLKEMWHRVHRFGFVLQVHNFKLVPPRSRDKWIMQAFIEAGYSAADLKLLNLVRQHQQVLFVSDVFSADGRKLDEKYLRRRPKNETWSTLIFPIQHLQSSHFHLWEAALQRISHPNNMIDSLGKIEHEGHKIWEWRFDRVNERVLRKNCDSVEIYVDTDIGQVSLYNRYA